MTANRILLGDCIEVLKTVPANHVDFVLTDPPYLVGYKDREGRSIKNDIESDWLKPAFRQVFRVLKADSLCVSFYGWNKPTCFLMLGNPPVFALLVTSLSPSVTARPRASCVTRTRALICWPRAAQNHQRTPSVT